MPNDLEFHFTDKDQKHMIHKQFVQYNYNGRSIAPLTDYAHNEVFQELPTEPDYFPTFTGAVHIDVRHSG